MLRQLLMGGAISFCNIVIHALVMTAVVRASQATAVKVFSQPNLLLITVMVATVSILMAAHVSEVIVWSLAYGLVDAAPADTRCEADSGSASTDRGDDAGAAHGCLATSGDEVEALLIKAERAFARFAGTKPFWKSTQEAKPTQRARGTQRKS